MFIMFNNGYVGNVDFFKFIALEHFCLAAGPLSATPTVVVGRIRTKPSLASIRSYISLASMVLDHKYLVRVPDRKMQEECCCLPPR